MITSCCFVDHSIYAFAKSGDIFGGAFGGFGGFGGGQRRSKGNNLRIRVSLDLKAIVLGVETTIKVKRKVKAKGHAQSTLDHISGL